MAPDAVHCKQLMINQLNKKSPAFVEAWKQQMRTERAEIFANRRRFLDDLTFNQHELRPTKPTDEAATIEAQYKVCLAQLRERAGTQIVESWRAKAVEERRLIFATHHLVCSELRGKSAKNALKSQPKSKVELKSALLKDINQQPVPEWKEREMEQRREAYEQRAMLICDIRAQPSQKEALLASSDVIVQRSRVMQAVQKRAGQAVEQWRQNVRDALAVPKMNKHLLLAELAQRAPVALKSSKCARDEMLAQIRRKYSVDSECVPEWKERACRQLKVSLQGKVLTCADISAKRFSLKKCAQHARLMEQIRQRSVADEAVPCWRQRERDVRSKAIRAKHATLVQLLTKRPTLKHNSESDRRAVLAAIRTEPVPAWKEAVQAVRVKIIQAKRQLTEDLKTAKLSSRKSVAEQKRLTMAQLRATAGKPVEAWKEIAMNHMAVQIGSKMLVHQALVNKSPINALKKTATVETNKNALLAAIRSPEPLPSWVEAERAQRATALNARNHVLAALKTGGVSVLKPTRSLETTKREVLAEIRRHREPLEAWREAEREQVAEGFAKKKQLNAAICDKKGRPVLRNMVKQSDLKELAMREIRFAMGAVVPMWKEKSMAKRCDTMKNKIELNQAILARGSC